MAGIIKTKVGGAMRTVRALAVLVAVLALVQVCARGRAQAALLLQDADGLAEVVSPIGHESVYFARICAASPTKLRRCHPGELGAVISRHSRIAGYDWVAMPVIPYLYSVEDASQVPAHVDRETVQRLRLAYHDAHLRILGDVREGNGIRRGWNQLVGAAYERRIWAFRFETTEAQDDALIARMNTKENRAHFSILLRNCADFSGDVLDFYFPHVFKRHIFPDAGIVTPRQIAYELVKYGHKHPEIGLTVMEIPLIPGMHHTSRVGMSAAESMMVTGYVIPIAVLSPYAAGVIVADALVWGRYPLRLDDVKVLSPETTGELGAGGVQTNAKTAKAPRTKPGAIPSNEEVIK
jgi:hypothetical protein